MIVTLKMKLFKAFILMIGSVTSFTSSPKKINFNSSLKAYPTFMSGVPGVLPPVGFFDPLGFAERANDATFLRYREAEVTHGRVAMLATVGFLVGEKVEGSSFLFDASIKGPAITHLSQVPPLFWGLLTIFIGASELYRAKVAFVNPAYVPTGQQGLMREDHYPGDIGFDPLNLKPKDPIEFENMATKELQHGRLAMLAAVGFMAQELVDGRGIIEHLQMN